MKFFPAEFLAVQEMWDSIIRLICSFSLATFSSQGSISKHHAMLRSRASGRHCCSSDDNQGTDTGGDGSHELNCISPTKPMKPSLSTPGADSHINAPQFFILFHFSFRAINWKAMIVSREHQRTLHNCQCCHDSLLCNS